MELFATKSLSRTCAFAFAVLIIVCLAAPADEAKPAQTARPADLDRVPEDAALFLRLRVGEHWNGRESAVLKKVAKAHPIVVTNWAQDLDKEIGIKMEEIDRAVLVVPEFKTADVFAVILTTREPLDRKKVLEAVTPEAKEMKVEGKTYYHSDKSQMGVQILNERTVLISSAKGIKAFLSRPRAEGGELRSIVVASQSGQLLVGGVIPSAFRAAIQQGGDDAKPFVPLFAARSWRITMEADKELQIRVRMNFANEEAAKEGQKALKAIAPPLTRYFEMIEKEFPAFAEREKGKYPDVNEVVKRLVALSKNARAALQDFPVERWGALVEGTLSLKTDEPATTFVLLLSMLPRAKKN